MSKNLCILFGGESSEHEVSRVSASYVLSIARGLEAKGEIKVSLIGIRKNGDFYDYRGADEKIATGEWEADPSCAPVAFRMSGVPGYHRLNGDCSEEFVPVDIFFPVLHGRQGEDGSIQGFFQLLGIPCAGCGTLGSAAMMDKDVARRLFADAGLAQPKWFAMTRYQLDKDPELLQRKIKEFDIPYPAFVKPANAGSSVGISKVRNESEWEEALKIAFAEDEKILVEEGINAREMEVAVMELEKGGELFASLPGEIIPGKEFYDYEDKYDANSASRLEIPARIGEEEIATIRQMALTAFKAGECTGLARCDFFMDKETGKILMNEINTMPGFTSISMYPKLILQSGYSAEDMLRTILSCSR